jgi:ubiquinone/menaquinone biosynthesis C-methylase UbiE
MATIIHDLSKRARDVSLREVARVLKPEGILNIIEFKKIDEGPGPPVGIRLREGEIESIVSVHGFKKVYAGEAGAYNYILNFKKSR